MQDSRRKQKTAYTDQIYRPPPKTTKISAHIIPRNTSDLDIDSLEHDINVDFEESVISEIYQRPDK